MTDSEARALEDDTVCLVKKTVEQELFLLTHDDADINLKCQTRKNVL